jgi:hypothetical protein
VLWPAFDFPRLIFDWTTQNGAEILRRAWTTPLLIQNKTRNLLHSIFFFFGRPEILKSPVGKLGGDLDPYERYLFGPERVRWRPRLQFLSEASGEAKKRGFLRA